MSNKSKTLEDRVAQIYYEKAIPVGQLYFPEWERYEAAFRNIFSREYYNNNGPVLAELESKLQDFLGVKHVICTSNATLGLMIAAQALELKGKVILPAHTFVASAQSLIWAGLSPVFCDVDYETQHIDIASVEPLIDDDVSAIMGVNLWGDACDISELKRIADKHDLKLYFDSAQAFGCQIKGKPIGGFGDVEVFSFHATKILSAGEGGAICTNDDLLAAKLKMIRPSYGETYPVDITKVANARMSEAQAAIALMSLDDFESNQENNFMLFSTYKGRLEDISGIKLKLPSRVSFSNYQSVVCEVDPQVYRASIDDLTEILKEKNILARRYFSPGTHRTVDFDADAFKCPVTDQLTQTCIQLPIGSFVDQDTVPSICDIIEYYQ